MYADLWNYKAAGENGSWLWSVYEGSEEIFGVDFRTPGVGLTAKTRRREEARNPPMCPYDPMCLCGNPTSDLRSSPHRHIGS